MSPPYRTSVGRLTKTLMPSVSGVKSAQCAKARSGRQQGLLELGAGPRPMGGRGAATKLLYNVVARPGALYRYWEQGQTGGPAPSLFLIGSIPGVIAGSVIRVELLPGPRAFEIVIAAVLIPPGSLADCPRATRRGECLAPF